jgi:nucleoside-diphosphate-sugar epimerase
MSKVFVTGGRGFIGTAVLSQLKQLGHKPVLVSRSSSIGKTPYEEVIIDGLDANTDWGKSLQECDVVIHLAARVHIMNDTSSDPLTEFRKVNTEGTLNLARQALESGVKRFIYLSSVKANGETTRLGFPFRPDDHSIPKDPYGQSKYEAERELLKLAKSNNMEVVIIRPPLVYGPGVKANFLRLMNLVNKEYPLPFGSVTNLRSFVGLDNLVDLICLCADSEKTPAAANEVFLVSDREDVSTAELIQKLARLLDKNVILLPVPVSLMTFIAKLLGKSDMVHRLFGSLQVDSSKASVLLGWQPVKTMDEQLRQTVDHFLGHDVK